MIGNSDIQSGNNNLDKINNIIKYWNKEVLIIVQ